MPPKDVYVTVEDVKYRVRSIDNYLQRKENNLMSIVWADWNKIKEYLEDYIEVMIENK